MPRNITRVRWSASNLPWGVTFNEANGTFEGTPDEVGEYVVPVTVQTNYGQDTKDVVIGVSHLYSVLILGSEAYNYSDRAGRDNYGFYNARGVSKASKLSSYPLGFRAEVADDLFYDAGVGLREYVPAASVTVFTNNSGSITKFTQNMSDFDQRRLAMYLCDVMSDGRASTGFEWGVLRTFNPMSGLEIRLSKYLIIKPSITTEASFANSVITIGIDDDFCPVDFQEMFEVNDGYRNFLSWLSHQGTRRTQLRFSANDKDVLSYTMSSGILGYKAIKMFDSSVFSYLSEDYYLNNEPDNFTYGVIKNAWGIKKVFYV